MSIQVAEILEMSVAERIQIVEDIWDSIALSPESLPITETERRELDSRLKSHAENPNEGIEWNQLRENLMKAK